ncbi:MAG: hypothetical protein ACFCUL_09280 [Flavobacteriaceae bacterium]
MKTARILFVAAMLAVTTLNYSCSKEDELETEAIDRDEIKEQDTIDRDEIKLQDT